MISFGSSHVKLVSLNEFNKRKILRKLKKFARRSDEIWDEELIQKFKETKELK